MTPEPLVVIESYVAEPEPLTPGQPFTLTLRVLNVGAADAQRVMLTLGKQGDASKSAPIAPLGTGNVRYLSELKAGAQADVVNQFIVDGTANAGVFVMTIGLEFSGSGEKPITRDEQISLVVKVLPQLLFNFYRPLPPAVVGQPIDLPDRDPERRSESGGQQRSRAREQRFEHRNRQDLRRPARLGMTIHVGCACDGG